MDLRALGRSLKTKLPRPVARWLKRVYHRHVVPLRYGERPDDAAVLAEYGVAAAPPSALRHRVHGEPELRSFLEGGRFISRFIVQGMEMAGQQRAASVLDFGCGSGRTLLWLQQQERFGSVHGTDIDREATTWVAAHLGIDARANAPMPPLPHADGAFDLLYCISVFTHLDEAFQDAWFAEFRRIVKPGGVLLVSCHSAWANALLPKADQELVERQGLLFYRDRVMGHVFPEFYQNTYHSARYIDEHWGAFFEIVGKLDMGAQDLVVMRNRPRG